MPPVHNAQSAVIAFTVSMYHVLFSGVYVYVYSPQLAQELFEEISHVWHFHGVIVSSTFVE